MQEKLRCEYCDHLVDSNDYIVTICGIMHFDCAKEFNDRATKKIAKISDYYYQLITTKKVY